MSYRRNNGAKLRSSPAGEREREKGQSGHLVSPCKAPTGRGSYISPRPKPRPKAIGSDFGANIIEAMGSVQPRGFGAEITRAIATSLASRNAYGPFKEGFRLKLHKSLDGTKFDANTHGFIDDQASDSDGSSDEVSGGDTDDANEFIDHDEAEDDDDEGVYVPPQARPRYARGLGSFLERLAPSRSSSEDDEEGEEEDDEEMDSPILARSGSSSEDDEEGSKSPPHSPSGSSSASAELFVGSCSTVELFKIYMGFLESGEDLPPAFTKAKLIELLRELKVVNNDKWWSKFGSSLERVSRGSLITMLNDFPPFVPVVDEAVLNSRELWKKDQLEKLASLDLVYCAKARRSQRGGVVVSSSLTRTELNKIVNKGWSDALSQAVCGCIEVNHHAQLGFGVEAYGGIGKWAKRAQDFLNRRGVVEWEQLSRGDGRNYWVWKEWAWNR